MSLRSNIEEWVEGISNAEDPLFVVDDAYAGRKELITEVLGIVEVDLDNTSTADLEEGSLYKKVLSDLMITEEW